MSESEMLSVRQAAESLCVSAATVYALIAAGKLACHRIGVGRGVIRISSDQIQKFLGQSVSQSEKRSIARPRPKLKHIKL